MTNDEAIAQLQRWKAYMDSLDADEDERLTVESLDAAIEALKEHKTGKWIKTARNGVLCSECKSGTRRMPMLLGNPLYKYCPFCGVKMEGVEE